MCGCRQKRGVVRVIISEMTQETMSFTIDTVISCTIDW